MKNIISNYKKYIALICGIVLIFAMVYPYARSASFSVFSGDDFSAANHLKGSELSMSKHIELGADYIKTNYYGWLGFYTSLFLNAILSPINILSMDGLGFLMFFNVILFYFSILFFCWILLRHTSRFNLSWIVVFVSIIYMTTAYKQLQESFYQLACAITYTIPASCALIGASLFLLYCKTKEKKYFAFGILFGLICCGGSLVDPALGCSLILLIITYIFLCNHGLDKNQIVFLSLWVLFSLFNALSPGNFARHSVIDDSGIHPIKAIVAGIVEYEDRFQFYSTQTDWVVIMLILLGCGLFVQKKDKFRNYAIVSIFALLVPVIVAFPVALGYSNFVYYSFPNRTVQIIDIAFLLSTSNFAIVCGAYIREKVKDITAFCIYISVLLIVILAIDGYSARENSSLKIFNGLRAGVYQDYNSDVRQLLDLIQTTDEMDLVISKEDYPDRIDGFICYELSTDYNFGTNKNTASYYGLNSICIDGE